jgi:hypothetical protein
MMCAVAMYSLVSQNQVVGPSVMAYSANTTAAAASAWRYGGRGAAGSGAGGAETWVCAVGATWLMNLWPVGTGMIGKLSKIAKGWGIGNRGHQKLRNCGGSHRDTEARRKNY